MDAIRNADWFFFTRRANASFARRHKMTLLLLLFHSYPSHFLALRWLLVFAQKLHYNWCLLCFFFIFSSMIFGFSSLASVAIRLSKKVHAQLHYHVDCSHAGEILRNESDRGTTRVKLIRCANWIQNFKICIVFAKNSHILVCFVFLFEDKFLGIKWANWFWPSDTSSRRTSDKKKRNRERIKTSITCAACAWYALVQCIHVQSPQNQNENNSKYYGNDVYYWIEKEAIACRHHAWNDFVCVIGSVRKDYSCFFIDNFQE